MEREDVSMLEGFRVLDLTTEIGHYCGKVLGDLGADVIKLEPPGGDPARNKGPFYHDQADPEKSLNWYFANLNKRGATLAIDTADGREILEKLVRKADIIVESFAPGFLESLSLGYGDLEKINPGIILTSITPFGRTGPYAGYQATDIVGVAMGGMARLYGYADSPPQRYAAPQFYLNGGIQGAVGSVFALYHREFTGEGQHVDVSCQQAMLLTLMVASEIWDLQKFNYRGQGPYYVSSRPAPHGPLRRRFIYPCRDGHILFFVGGGGALGIRTSTEKMFAWAISEGCCREFEGFDWLHLDYATMVQEEQNRHDEAIGEFILTKTKAELFAYSLEHKIILAPASNAKDVAESPQLAFRKFWVDVDHPELGEKITYPGWPMKWTDLPPYQPQRRAPLIGEHNEEIYVGELGLSTDELALLKGRGIL